MIWDIPIVLSLLIPSVSAIWMGGRVLSRIEVQLETLSLKVGYLSERIEELEGFERGKSRWDGISRRRSDICP